MYVSIYVYKLYYVCISNKSVRVQKFCNKVFLNGLTCSVGSGRFLYPPYFGEWNEIHYLIIIHICNIYMYCTYILTLNLFKQLLGIPRYKICVHI